uniref:Uncharacterized protein n=1 Tax=Anguilla anguilla TaxID=7936 RepID=A0A0E9UJT7_ANGAN
MAERERNNSTPNILLGHCGYIFLAHFVVPRGVACIGRLFDCCPSVGPCEVFKQLYEMAFCYIQPVAMRKLERKRKKVRRLYCSKMRILRCGQLQSHRC